MSEHGEECWVYLACFACNSLAGVQRPLDDGDWIHAERRAANAVRRMTKRLFSLSPADPMTLEAIEKDVKLAKVNSKGEEVGVCHRLNVRQIQPSLPPHGHGGCIDLLQ